MTGLTKKFFIPALFLASLGIAYAQIETIDTTPPNKSYQATKEQNRFKLNPLRQSLANYDVIHYQINLSIDPNDNEIIGFVEIVLLPVVNIETNLLFDFAGLQLDSVFIGPNKASFSRENELLTVYPSATIVAGDTQQVSFCYQGKPLKGLYFRPNAYGEMIVYSHNEPYDAHYWFPCKDQPADKATSSVTVNVPTPMIALSNGTLMGQSNAGPGSTIFAWYENYPIATYLISIAAGPYKIAADEFVWESKVIPLAYWVYSPDLDRGAQALLWTKEMLVFFSEFIGDYPFLLEKYDMVEVPFREAAAMENQTATTMGDFVMDNVGVIAHELAHQWWGDALTPKTFVDIWLNEGFASYFDALFTEYKYGEEAYQQQMDLYKNKMNSDGSLPYPIYDPPERYMFGNAVYMKGAWILHMLRFEAGESVFKKIIRDYYEDYKYGTITTENLRRITEVVTGESWLKFFDQWLNYGGMPVIIGDWQQEENITTIMLEQFQQDPIYHFNLEVLVKGTSADTLIIIPVSERITKQKIYFADTVTEVDIDPLNKILNTNNGPLYNIPQISGFLNIYPNPFQNKITIVYQVSKKEHIEILIFDVLGQLVKKLVDESKILGIYQVEWHGETFASGNYYCTIKTSENVETRKITLVK